MNFIYNTGRYYASKAAASLLQIGYDYCTSQTSGRTEDTVRRQELAHRVRMDTQQAERDEKVVSVALGFFCVIAAALLHHFVDHWSTKSVVVIVIVSFIARITLLSTENFPGNSSLLQLHKFFRRLFSGPSELENLVFKGGGPAAIAYVGAIDALERLGKLSDVQRVAGASAGAITAALVAMGYTADQMKEIVKDMPLAQFLDHPLFKKEQALAQALHRWQTNTQEPSENILNTIFTYIAEKGTFFAQSTPQTVDNEQRSSVAQHILNYVNELSVESYSKGGLCEGEQFREWIEKNITNATGIQHCTFGEFRKKIEAGKLQAESGQPFKHLFLSAAKIENNTTSPVCMNSQDATWDDVIISDAVRAAISIPILFRHHTLHVRRPSRIREKEPSFGLFLDGAILKNFPIDLFDAPQYCSIYSRNCSYNPKTLGLNLSDPSPTEQRDPSTSATVSQVAFCVLNTYMHREEILLAKEKHRNIININNLGVGLLTGFFMSRETRTALINSGYECVSKYYEANLPTTTPHRGNGDNQTVTNNSSHIERNAAQAEQQSPPQETPSNPIIIPDRPLPLLSSHALPVNTTQIPPNHASNNTTELLRELQNSFYNLPQGV